MPRTTPEHVHTAKNDAQVINDLEKIIYNLFIVAENAIKNGRRETARRNIVKAREYYKVRGYATEVDKRSDEIYDAYMAKFL